jgi:hypothetical protein
MGMTRADRSPNDRFQRTVRLAAYVMGPSMVERRPFDAPDPSYTSWGDILADPQPITLRTYSTAMMETHLFGVINLEHERAGDIEDELIELPVVVGILEHTELGAYLVDNVPPPERFSM